MTYLKPVCRGSWSLGTACRICERCVETDPRKRFPASPPDRMPDRIWAWDSHEGHEYSLNESAWGRHQYVRAAPELLALIEAAKAWSAAKRVPYGPLPTTELHSAALAFAKSQDHPDAG